MAAQDELNQLERVFLRLGHAETDDQLQDIISKFLPPVLLKLSSVQEGVRKKCKLGIVKFIEAKQVPEVETVVHLVVASSDTRHSVATAADLELKSKQR
ncbi:unnamed protein product [Tetraodon nigroviridis]|uniref:(spotted green pufferfish) hypothetical protein n=1 Tax=Tetraodon nigroviridis TaxID=99883 RepID=Q4T5K4_TETNG|nr:unnamed protein product [Tetraodon nigroviridis]